MLKALTVPGVYLTVMFSFTKSPSDELSVLGAIINDDEHRVTYMSYSKSQMYLSHNLLSLNTRLDSSCLELRNPTV